MNLKELKEIIDIVTSEETIEELEIEKSGVRLRIKRASNHSSPASAVATHVAAAAVPAVSAPAAPQQLPPAVEEELYYQKSPIVGTFYKAVSPTSEPFVSVGEFVEKGTVLCIIEAMKLMNEIEADVAGEIVSVLVDNGQPVEYGETLFAIRQR
jgi:acetyl-CoA carboxylase biotin carboxyl carrier protein